jgi:hypothetical protein
MNSGSGSPCRAQARQALPKASHGNIPFHLCTPSLWPELRSPIKAPRHQAGSHAFSMPHGKCRCRTLGEVRSNRVPRPLVRVQRINSPSSYLQLCNLLQSSSSPSLHWPARALRFRAGCRPASGNAAKRHRRTSAWADCITFIGTLHKRLHFCALQLPWPTGNALSAVQACDSFSSSRVC